MKISPSHPYQTKSYAELLVFDSFREVFSNERGILCFSFAQFNKAQNEKVWRGRFCNGLPFGVYTLEVKGGSRLSYENGSFYTHNKRGIIIYKIRFDKLRQRCTLLKMKSETQALFIRDLSLASVSGNISSTPMEYSKVLNGIDALFVILKIFAILNLVRNSI